MKKKITIVVALLLLLIAGGVSAYFLLYKDIPYFKTIRKIRVAQFTKTAIQVNCDVICFNPNEVGLTLSDSEFDIYANGKLVSHLRQNGGSNVGPNTDFTIPLKASFSPTKVFRPKDLLGAAFLSLKSKKIDLRYKGDVKVLLAGQEIAIPVDYEDAVSLKK